MLTEKENKIKERLIEVGDFVTNGTALYKIFEKELPFTLYKNDGLFNLDYTVAGMVFDEAISDDTTDLFVKWILNGDRKSYVKLKNWFIDYAKQEADFIVPKKDDKHYIYIVQMIDDVNNYYKIGRSSNAKGRIGVHDTSSPHPIKTIFIGKVKNAIIIEARLHRMFKDKNVRKEWFKLDDKDIEKALELIKKGDKKSG